MKKRILKITISSIIFASITWLGLATYFLKTTKIEDIVLCIGDKDKAWTEKSINLPAGMCDYFLRHYRNDKEDISQLEQGTGLSFVLHARDRRLSDYFIKNGINVNKVSPLTGLTPLHNMVVNNDIELVKYLLEHGADVKVKADAKFYPAAYTSLELLDMLSQKDPKTDRSAVRQLLIAAGAGKGS